MSNCYFQTDLSVLVDNIQAIKNIRPASTIFIAVVKANAYGHGILKIALFLDQCDTVDMFAVASAHEANMLIDCGIKKPILVLSHVASEDVSMLIASKVRFTVYDVSYADLLAKEAKKQKTCAKLHIKIDTGMNRLGFSSHDPCTVEKISQICQLEHVHIEAVYSHFADADDLASSYPKKQFRAFVDMLCSLQAKKIRYDFTHMANSAATLGLPFIKSDGIRIGLSMYGYSPFLDLGHAKKPSIAPIGSLYARINHIKRLEKGEYVSYGLTYKTPGPRIIATVAAGYADGFPRYLSNNYAVKIRDQYAPICGTVCMDQFMIDITDIPKVAIGDYVMLFGDDPNGLCTAQAIAKKGETIVYEILCGISHRVRRIYLSP